MKIHRERTTFVVPMALFTLSLAIGAPLAVVAGGQREPRTITVTATAEQPVTLFQAQIQLAIETVGSEAERVRGCASRWMIPPALARWLTAPLAPA